MEVWNMGRLPLRLAMWDYDYVLPLAIGDVSADGIEVSLIRKPEALDLVLNDPEVDGGEASFSRYLHRIVKGDKSFVGLPVFLMREFRQRCFFVRRDDSLEDVSQLAGKSVGTDVWAASGNVWSRALIRERGVALASIAWRLGRVNPGDLPVPIAEPPRGVKAAPVEGSLSESLVRGEIAAIMCSLPPEEFHSRSSRIRRLYRNYRNAEREYYLRTKIFPAHHILVLRRAVVGRHPWVVPKLYAAFRAARKRSENNHLVLHESSPWILADLEDRRTLMGDEFEPYGYRENQAMVATFCEEQFVQELIGAALKPDLLFEEFEILLRRA
jgi:4,5-dihydroxyphthalate decarboxylase